MGDLGTVTLIPVCVVNSPRGFPLFKVRTMPPKKTTKKVLPPSPSGRGCGPAEDHEGPAPAQPEVQGDQDHEVPPLRKNDDDQDISFEDEEHDDEANPNS